MKTLIGKFDKSTAAVEDFILPRLDIHDLILGKVLGQGGFGTVIEILPRVVISDDNDVPPPPQDDIIVEDKKNSPRSAAGNSYTFNWWKLQWDENIKNDGKIMGDNDCIPGDVVSLLDCIVHISTTTAESSSSLFATHHTTQ